jgi:CRP/FNR family transcriptional regulator, dissimilatory nitrate respiration regulator
MKMNIKDDIRTLSNSILFKGIANEEIEKLILAANPVEKRYHADAVVAFTGDAYERLLLVIEGVLTTEIIDLRGKTLQLERFMKSQSIANGILFASDNTLPVQILAETDVRLLSFSKQSIITMCRDNHFFLENFLRDGGDRVKLLAAKVRFHKFNTIQQKIAIYFRDLSLSQGTNNISLPYSIEILSEVFGVARPALSRSLADLVAKGLLTRNGREYIITNPDGLKSMVAG